MRAARVTRRRPAVRAPNTLEALGFALLAGAAGFIWASRLTRSHSSDGKGEAFGEAADQQDIYLQMQRAREPKRGRHATSPLQIPWRGWRDILLRTYQQIGEDRLFSVAAGVVFLGLLALFPAVTAIVSIYGLFADRTTINEHLEILASALPPGAYTLVADQVARVVAKGDGSLTLGLVLGLLISLWSANAGVKAVIDSLNVVYGEKERRGFFTLNFLSLTFTLGAVGFVLSALALVVVFPLAMESLRFGDTLEWTISLARWPLFISVMLVALAVLYRFGPDRRAARLQWLTIGSVAASIIWAIVSAAFSFYLSYFADYDAQYGTLGGAIGLMMWMWLTAIVVLAGAELNAEIEHQTAEDTTIGGDKPLGARGAVMADTVGEAQ